MNDHDRREFLRIATTGALGLSAVTLPLPIAASPSTLFASPHWRSLLLARRSRVQSLQLTLVSRLTYVSPHLAADNGNSLWVLEGSSEVFFDSGRYRLVHSRDALQFTEVSAEGRYVQIVERGGHSSPEVLYDGPLTTGSRPGISLDRFMPILKDRPAYNLGTDLVNGESCEGLGQDNIHMFISPTSATILRLEAFRGAAAINERVDYRSHTVILGDVPFPQSILSTRFGSGESIRTVQEISIKNVTANQPIPDSSFGFPR